MQNNHKYIGVLLLTSLTVAAGAMTRRADVADSSYLSLANMFPAVGMVTFNDGTYMGSGTLISNQWVLTAAHVQGTNMTFAVGGTTYSVIQYVQHPSWNSATLDYDFGLMKLSSSVGNVTPAALYGGSSEVGSTATIVGYGRTGTGTSGATSFDGKKRAGTNIVDALDGPTRVRTDFDMPFGATSLEQCVAPGDSGGGMFLSVGGQYQLAGVTSFLWASDGNLDADYGDGSGFGRVYSVKNWINSVVPEPGTITALGIGALALIARRRRLR